MSAGTRAKIIDMTPDGRIGGPPVGQHPGPNATMVLAAVAGGALLLVAGMVWLTITLLPTLLLVGLVLFVISMIRSRRRRGRGRQGAARLLRWAAYARQMRRYGA